MKASDAKYIEQLKKENRELQDQVAYLRSAYMAERKTLLEVYSNKDKLISERNWLWELVRNWNILATEGMDTAQADLLADRVRTLTEENCKQWIDEKIQTV